MKKMERQKRDPEAKMKTLEEKVQTLRQVLIELKTEAEESIKDYESTNPFAVKVSGKIEGFKTAIDLVDLIDHLKARHESVTEVT